MKKIFYIPVFLLATCLFISHSTFAQIDLKVTYLTCNHFTNPTGVLDKPVLGWQSEARENGQLQTGYQIIVASSEKNLTLDKGDVWDSQKVVSANQNNIKYGGKPLESSKIYYWKVRVWDKNNKASAWSKNVYFITGITKKEDFKAQWITSNKAKGQPAPLFRKSFSLKNKPKNAIIHISGLGYYELYVNGKKVGDHVLDPGQTNYDEYGFYVTYNIDTLLKKGENVIGVMLGDGWYNQDVVWGGTMTYGKPLMWCQLDFMDNGIKNNIVSDASWEWANGPILSNNVYAGEVYDAQKEIKGWHTTEVLKDKWNAVYMAEKHPPMLKPQDLQPIKKMAELPVKRFYKTAKGSYVFDMGQNFAGWNRLKVTAPKGTEITLKMAEEVYPDGTLNHITTGFYATKVEQTEKYICKGTGVEIWEPRFTYHGFRYVEVIGLKEPPTADLLRGIVVYSSMPATGNFSCSNTQINKLHELNYWTLIGNLHSIPTDCPHREKCGWLGDAHAMAQSTIYNLDMQNFWLKFLDDIHSAAKVEVNTLFHLGKNKHFRKDIKKAGIPFIVSPGKRLISAASPDWGTAIVQLPWFLYAYYGNISALEKFYPDMKQWVLHTLNLNKDHINYEGLGDWCPPKGIDHIDCPVALSSTAFHYNDLNIMKKAAGLLGFKADSIAFSDSAALVKKAFVAKFFDPQLNSFGSHTANAMVLDFGLAPDGKEKAIANAIVKTSKEQFGGFMYAGIFGLQRLFGQLSNYGNEQAAYDILDKKGENSFETMWAKFDATTMWEMLPIDTVEVKNEGTARRSHNHPMQSGFDAWFFNGIAGIQPDLSAPGFKKIILQPQLLNQLQWAKGSYNSMYGSIVSNWKWVNKQLVWDITIPVNTTAEIKLPNVAFTEMTINNKDNIKINKSEKDFNYTMPSGKYRLVFKPS